MKNAAGLLERLWPKTFLIAILGVFCAAAIHKASLAIAPPVYDSLSYYWKAVTSVRAVKAGEWLSLMATDPTMRPPGFLLLNGMFGIDRDVSNFRGFFALNMILPALLWSLACWIAIPLRRQTPRLLWQKAFAVAALSLIPMFLQFEYSENIKCSTAWGMQDTVLAASAALAMALVLHSAKHRQTLFAVAGFLLSGFTIMIKPAGILVMLAVTGAWILESCIRWFFLKSPNRIRIHKQYFFRTLVPAIGIQGVIFSVAFFSPYFSKEIIALSVSNQSALVSMNQKQDFGEILTHTFLTAFGAIWTLFFLVAIPGCVFLLLRSSKRMFRTQWPSLFSSLAIFLAAFYWWRYMSGTEARYIFPFFCLSIILLLPAMWTCWMHHCPSRIRSGITGLLAILILVYSIALVWPEEIPVGVQEFLGVNLSTAGHGDSVEAAKFLMEKAKQSDRPVIFYQAEMSYCLAFISGWLQLKNLEKDPIFKIESTFNWKSEEAFPKNKLIHSDFIALDLENFEEAPSSETIGTRKGEFLLFIDWLARQRGESGVQRYSFGKIDILEVVDRKKFEVAFDALVVSNASLLRREFLAYNGYLEDSWQNLNHARANFSVTGKNLGGILSGLRDLEEYRLKDDGVCVPLGRDPYFCLKPFLNLGSSQARVHIQTLSTVVGALQIFYSPRADAFTEAKSIWRSLTPGFSEVMATIPVEGETTWLRFDLPGPPVETTIKKISITLVDPVNIGNKP